MSKHYGKLNEVKEFMVKEGLNHGGFINIGYKEIAEKTGMNNLSSARNMVLKLIEQKVIAVEQAPRRGTKDATYRLLLNLAPSVIPNEEDKFEKVSLGGLDFMLLKTEDLGLCMSLEDLSVALIESGDTLQKIIKSNSELFSKCTTIYDEKVYLNRRAVSGILMKLNLDKVIQQKREALHLFNETILNRMQEVSLFGKVVLLEGDRIQIRSNLETLTDLKPEEVAQMFHKIEDDFTSILTVYAGDVNSAKHELAQVSKKVGRMANQLETEKRRYETCLTQNVELKGKLMERSSN